MKMYATTQPEALHQSNGAWFFNLNAELIPGEGDTPDQWVCDSVPLPGAPDATDMIRAGILARYTAEDEIALINNRNSADYAAYLAYRESVKTQMRATLGLPEPTEEERLQVWREHTEVSRFKARMALLNAGMFDAVETMMADPATPVLAKEAWANAQTFRRLSPTVLGMGATLGMTDAQLDELFRVAETIEA